MSFDSLIFDQKILRAIQELGYTTPTPIQEKAIPKLLEGCDLRASAETGSGKTGAFLLPALSRLSNPRPGNGPRILVLVPTRELACQVAAEAVKYSKYLQKVKTVCIYGGAPYPPQNRDLARPYEILVATPGRLIDHMEQKRIQFSRLELLVLDEADRMLDMGFIQPVEQIAKATPKDRQTVLFSATMKGSVLNLSKRLLKEPVEISIVSDISKKHENIEERLFYVDNIEHKKRLLDHFLDDETFHQAIVFTATKRQADCLAKELHEAGRAARALHGDMNQRERTRTMQQMRKNAIRVLVATDVAARGLDVSTISHVVNFDLPMNVEDYVHRIGRTGRAGASGIALSFASPKDVGAVNQIEKYIGHKMNVHTVAGFEPSKRFDKEKKRTPPPKRGFHKRRPFKKPGRTLVAK